MNVKEYIASGIIESYVLGLASQAEREEFEAMCAQYPEVAQARTAFEIALENQLMEEAVAPPVAVRERTLAAIEALHTPLVAEVPEITSRPVRSIGMWKWMAAASVLLLAGAAWWAVTAESRYREARAENDQLKRELERADDQLAQLRQDAEVLQKSTVKMAALEGTPQAPNAFATVYWDSTSKDVYLMINNLPKPASDKQYQLWALINDQPVDLGVFEMRQERLLVKMKGVQQAQAFAITLEPKGGSPSPTLESMYVIGKL